MSSDSTPTSPSGSAAIAVLATAVPTVAVPTDVFQEQLTQFLAQTGRTMQDFDRITQPIVINAPKAPRAQMQTAAQKQETYLMSPAVNTFGKNADVRVLPTRSLVVFLTTDGILRDFVEEMLHYMAVGGSFTVDEELINEKVNDEVLVAKINQLFHRMGETRKGVASEFINCSYLTDEKIPKYIDIITNNNMKIFDSKFWKEIAHLFVDPDAVSKAYNGGIIQNFVRPDLVSKLTGTSIVLCLKKAVQKNFLASNLLQCLEIPLSPERKAREELANAIFEEQREYEATLFIKNVERQDAEAKDAWDDHVTARSVKQRVV